MHASEIWQSSSLKARLIRTSLLPASWGYAFGWEIYLAVYSFGLKHPKSPHSPVICIGNLQVGGSGKTPITRFLARHLSQMGYPVAISSSGYGSKRSESATLAPAGQLLASEWGDEAAMLRWLEPDFPLVVGRNRIEAAEITHRELPNHVLLMDDGFQHLPLLKDLTILLDPANPVNSFCLPAGPYREPRWNRKRANLCVPGDLTVLSQPTRLEDRAGHEARPKRYSVLCALGNPQKFLDALTEHVPSEGGFAKVAVLPDHDSLQDCSLLDQFLGDEPIVVTAKDWVKIRERADLDSKNFLIATQDVSLEPIDVIERWLKSRYDR